MDRRDVTQPLDTEAVLWVAAIDRVPIEERIKTMLERVEQINEARRA